MIRVLRVKATGQWGGPAIIGSRLPEDDSYADRVAETLGLEPGSLEIIDAEEDPRAGPLLEDPNKPEILDTPPPRPSFTDEEIIKLKAVAATR